MEIPEGQRARVEDLISYTPDSYFSDDELTLIRNTFNGPQGARLVKILRKVMLPTITDPELPIEEIGRDVFMAKVDFLSMTKEEAKEIATALQMTAKGILGGLVQLRQLATIKEESPQSRTARREKDSSR